MTVEDRGIPVMGHCVSRLQLDGTLQLSLGRCPVVVPVENQAEGGVGFGNGVIDLKSLQGMCLRFRIAFDCPDRAVFSEQAIGVGEADVRQRIAGIEVDRPLEQRD